MDSWSQSADRPCGWRMSWRHVRVKLSRRRSFVVITHYQRLLNYIVPDVVHVLSRGRIVRTGGKELALDLEATGYARYQEEMA